MVLVAQGLRTHVRVAAESRVTLQRAITNYRTRGMLETTMNQSETPGRRDLVQSKTYEITFLGQAGTTLSAAGSPVDRVDLSPAGAGSWCSRRSHGAFTGSAWKSGRPAGTWASSVSVSSKPTEVAEVAASHAGEIATLAVWPVPPSSNSNRWLAAGSVVP